LWGLGHFYAYGADQDRICHRFGSPWRRSVTGRARPATRNERIHRYSDYTIAVSRLALYAGLTKGWLIKLPSSFNKVQEVGRWVTDKRAAASSAGEWSNPRHWRTLQSAATSAITSDLERKRREAGVTEPNRRAPRRRSRALCILALGARQIGICDRAIVAGIRSRPAFCEGNS